MPLRLNKPHQVWLTVLICTKNWDQYCTFELFNLRGWDSQLYRQTNPSRAANSVRWQPHFCTTRQGSSPALLNTNGPDTTRKSVSIILRLCMDLWWVFLQFDGFVKQLIRMVGAHLKNTPKYSNTKNSKAGRLEFTHISTSSQEIWSKNSKAPLESSCSIYREASSPATWMVASTLFTVLNRKRHGTTVFEFQLHSGKLT